MVVKLNGASNIQCQVGALDLSRELVSFSGSYSSLSLPSSGLVMMTGQLSLTQSNRSNIDFDSRFSNIWRRGTKIKLTANGRPLPVVGEAYIITADYDMASSLSISFGCQLSLYNYRTQNDTGVCVEFGEEFPIGTLMANLLQAAGVDGGDIDLNSFNVLNRFHIIQPLLIGSSQSLIQAAGTLAGKYGAIIVQRPDGTIVLKQVNENNNYQHVLEAGQLQAYTRTGLPETIVKQIEFNYEEEALCSPLGTTSKSIRSGDTIVEVDEQVEKEARTSTSIMREIRDINGNLELISETTTISTFEAASQRALEVNRDGSITSLEKCFPDSESRILSKEVISTSDNTELVKAWLAAKAKADPSNTSSFTISGTITGSRTLESYLYKDTEYIKTTQIFQPRAVAIPLSGDLTLGRSGGQQITDIDPTTLIIFQQVVEIWSRPEEACQRWTYSKTTLQNKATVRPDDINIRILDASEPLEDIVADGLTLTPIDRELQFNQAEPTFDNFQINSEIASIPKRFTVGSAVGTGNIFEIKEEINLGGYGVFDEEYFLEYGSRIMAFRNGRILGMQVALGAWVLEDKWNSFLPLERAKIVEPSHLRQNTASVLLMDSPSIVASAEEVVLSYTGSFVAFSQEPNNTNHQTDELFNPISLPIPVPLLSYQALDGELNPYVDFSFTIT